MKKVNVLLAVLLVIAFCFGGCSNAQSTSNDSSDEDNYYPEDTYTDSAVGFYKDSFGNELDLFEDGSFCFEYEHEETSFSAQGYWSKNTNDDYYTIQSTHVLYYINGENHTGIELSGTFKSSDEAYGSVLAYNLISSDYTSSVMKIYFTKE